MCKKSTGIYNKSIGQISHYASGIAFGCVVLVGSAAWPVWAQHTDEGPRIAGLCVACHGIDGNSFKPNYPRLAGQQGAYLVQQLLDFKEGRRQDPNMNAVAAGLSREDIFDLANFFSKRSRPIRPMSNPETPTTLSDKATALFATCILCHESPMMAPVRAPYIVGQQNHYLAKQLQDFKRGRRIDTGDVMTEIAAVLTDTDITNIADVLNHSR